MELALIKENQWTAREKYLEYLKGVKERHTAEYVALKRAYREIARGKRVLQIVQTMRAAGLDAQGHPKLAISRADQKVCWFSTVNGPGRFVFSPSNNVNWRQPAKSSAVYLPGQTFGDGVWEKFARVYLRSVVPTIPPALLPGDNLDRYWILWEAEWESVTRDPVLLQPLGEGLFVVLATWDLTDLERSILFNRI